VGAQEVEVTAGAQKAWVDLLLTGPGRMIGMNDCTPGYYNNEGHPAGASAKYAVGYPAGPSATSNTSTPGATTANTTA
jgi:cyclohexanone monooxygenase